MTLSYDGDDGSDEQNSDLPYPTDGDRLDDHVAHRDGHAIEQVWFHKARDMRNEDSDSKHEYHHSESRVKLQSTKKDTEVIWSDWSVNLDRCR